MSKIIGVANLFVGQPEKFTVAASSGETVVGGLTDSGLTVSTVPYADASKKFQSSAVTPTELGYVHGVTSALQTQLDAKSPLANPTFTGTVAAAALNLSGDFAIATTKFTVASATGNTVVAGTLGVTGVATLTAQPILSSLSASQAVFSDGSKGLVSNAITGTGNVVMSAAPTLTGIITAAIANFSGAVSTDAFTASNNSGPVITLNRNQAISGNGILMYQANTTDGNSLALEYQSDSTGSGAAANTQFAGIKFSAVTHDNSTRAGSIAMYTAQGGTGYVQRLSINGVGLAAFSAAVTIGTTLGVTGIISANDTTDSTTTGTGGLIASGGLGVTKAAWIGGLANIAGVLTAANTTDTSSTSTGGLVTTGGLGVAKAANIGTTLGIRTTLTASLYSAALAVVTATSVPTIAIAGYGSSQLFNQIIGYAARGTEAAPTTVQADDFGTWIGMKGFVTGAVTGSTPDGWITGTKGVLGIAAEAIWTSSSTPTYMAMYTCKSGTTSRIERTRINGSGSLELKENSGDAEAATLVLNEKGTTPANPTQDTQLKIYMKSDKIVIQFNNGGTTRYVTYDLTQSATALWATSTSAP